MEKCHHPIWLSFLAIHFVSHFLAINLLLKNILVFYWHLNRHEGSHMRPCLMNIFQNYFKEFCQGVQKTQKKGFRGQLVASDSLCILVSILYLCFRTNLVITLMLTQYQLSSHISILWLLFWLWLMKFQGECVEQGSVEILSGIYWPMTLGPFSFLKYRD